MPRFKTEDDEGDIVERYRWHAEYVTPVECIGPMLRDWRRSATRDREEFLNLQKLCGRDDPEFARFFKQSAKRCLRLIRAITLAIPWFDMPDANQLESRPLLWPIDLADELDEVARFIMLNFG